MLGINMKETIENLKKEIEKLIRLKPELKKYQEDLDKKFKKAKKVIKRKLNK